MYLPHPDVGGPLSIDQTRLKADQAVHMIFQNKVNSKNAFEIDTDYLSSLSKLLQDNPTGKRDNESSWLRASASLDASAKIYGFRVDQVHQETYKVLGGLHRQEMNNKQNADNGENIDPGDLYTMLNGLADQDDSSLPISMQRKGRRGVSVQNLGYNVIFTGGDRTLEKDLKNIDITRFDIEAETDPLYR